MYKKEIDFYKNARIADEGLHTFQLCGVMEHNGERFPVEGEVGSEWLEVHEVGTYFNFPENDENYDGAFYYVGNTSLDPLRPPHSEVNASVNFAAAHSLPLDYSTRLAKMLLDLGEAEYVKPPIVLAMEMYWEFRKAEPGSRIWFELTEKEKDGWVKVAEWVKQNV